MTAARPASCWEPLAALPLRVEGYALEGMEKAVTDWYTRLSTVVRLRGGGAEGVGEDVTYEAEDQRLFQKRDSEWPLSGEFTLASFSEELEKHDFFGEAPHQEAARDYRRWAFESAALDLALQQAGTGLAAVLDREYRPMRFLTSMNLGHPASLEPMREWLAPYPDLCFKLDAAPSWNLVLLEELAATGAVEVVDLKGFYSGTPVDLVPDPVLYRQVAEILPQAWIEDPRLTPETDAALEPYRDRITWDAPIHSVEDIRALPFPPRCLNMKPSRFGSLRRLFEAYAWCEERGIAMYGGGQFELGPGRGQCQLLASLFHADGPNDLAPVSYNVSAAVAGLPGSPLDPQPAPCGFQRRD